MVAHYFIILSTRNINESNKNQSRDKFKLGKVLTLIVEALTALHYLKVRIYVKKEDPHFNEYRDIVRKVQQKFQQNSSTLTSFVLCEEVGNDGEPQMLKGDVILCIHPSSQFYKHCKDTDSNISSGYKQTHHLLYLWQKLFNLKACSSLQDELNVNERQTNEDELFFLSKTVSLLSQLIDQGFIVKHGPLHFANHSLEAPSTSTKPSSFPPTQQQALKILKYELSSLNLYQYNKIVRNICDYYGSKVGFYFAWMHHYILWLLCGPAMCGILTWVLLLVPEPVIFDEDTTVGSAVDESPWMCIYASLVVLWAHLFLKYWCRRASSLSSTSTTMNPTAAALLCSHCGNPTTQTSSTTIPITPLIDNQNKNPSWQQSRQLQRYLVWYPLSLCVSAFLLGVCFGVMCISLNLQGYLNGPPPQDHHPRVSLFHSPLHISWAAHYARPVEGIFSDTHPLYASYYLYYLPVLGHTLCIFLMNKVYSEVAYVLTKWEKHSSEEHFQFHFILKRFLFEAMDCYMALFYICFYEMDVIKLRQELLALFMVDQLRRLCMETLLPYVMQHYYNGEKSIHAGTQDNNKKNNQDISMEEMYRECVFEEGIFDDYLEMVIQFGYITLFAAAFPLGGFLAFLSNCVEIRSDLIKLTLVYRRPLPLACSNIAHIWFVLLRCIAWLAIPTNVFIMGCTSEQLMSVFPSRFSIGAPGGVEPHSAKVSGLWLMIGIEHVLIVLALGIEYGIAATSTTSVVLVVQKEKDTEVVEGTSHAKKQN